MQRLARLRLLDSRCFLENSKSYFREIALFPILLFFRFALRFGHVESCHRSTLREILKWKLIGRAYSAAPTLFDADLYGILRKLEGEGPKYLTAIIFSCLYTMWEKGKDLARSFKRELTTYQRVLADSRTPIQAKIFLGLAVGFLCMPFHLIPDFIPVIGHLDDVIIVPALVYLGLRFVPPELVAEHRRCVASQFSKSIGFAERSVSLGRQGRLDYVNFGTYVPRI